MEFSLFSSDAKANLALYKQADLILSKTLSDPDLLVWKGPAVATKDLRCFRYFSLGTSTNRNSFA